MEGFGCWRGSEDGEALENPLPKHRLPFGERELGGPRSDCARGRSGEELLLAQGVGVEGGEGVNEREGVSEEGDEATRNVEVDELGEVVTKEGEDGGEGRLPNVEQELPLGLSSRSCRGVL